VAYYIVRDDGTAVGDAGRYTSQQTGPVAALGTANYYGSRTLAYAATTPPVAGDFILFSDLHVFTQASSISLTGTYPLPVLEVCVDDANMENSRTSGNRGSEAVTGGNPDFIMNNEVISGLEISSGDNIVFNLRNRIVDCKLVLAGTSDRITM